MTVKLFCDGCGREMSSRDVKVRIFWRKKIVRETATGKITEKWVVVRGDFCSFECFTNYLKEVMAGESLELSEALNIVPEEAKAVATA